MWSDVVDLREFYESRRGQVARHLIRHRLRQVWPDLRGQSLLGLGYATPYLRQFLGEAERVVALMPAPQGVVHWPPEGPNLVALAEETDLPLPDYSLDRVLLVHGLEGSESLREMLREVWRVMTSNARLLIVVPNRRGIWARSDRTPFGNGHPYSQSQLSRLLRDNGFTPTRSERALYIPPGGSKTLMRAAPAWERLGARWFPTFSGVLLMEAGKQLYTAREKPARRHSLTSVVAFPQPAAAPKPASRNARRRL